MADFFLPRHRRLLGLPEATPAAQHTSELPHCCEKVEEEERCRCDARRWRCPTHGRLAEPCRQGNSHD